jgi:hypothetical protein
MEVSSKKEVVLAIEWSPASGLTGAELLWRSPDGVEQSYAQLTPGTEGEVIHVQSTFEGDSWIVRAAGSNQLLLEYTANGQEVQRVVLRDDASSSQAHGDASLSKLLQRVALDNSPAERVVLNVGGIRYETTRATLSRYPASLLARVCCGQDAPR